MEFQKVCERVVADVDGAMAFAVVDLDSGLLLGDSASPGVSRQIVNQAVRLAGAMFRGKLTAQFVEALPSRAPLDGYVQEAQVSTDNCRHFFSVVPGWPNALVVLVSDQSVSIGLGWMALHQALTHLDGAGDRRTPGDRTGQPRGAGHGTEGSRAERPAPADPARRVPVEPAISARPPREGAAGDGPGDVPDPGGDGGAPAPVEPPKPAADEAPAGEAADTPARSTVRRMGARAFVKSRGPGDA